MPEVVVVATFRARPEHLGEVEAVLRGACEPTHAEQGCILYALHRGVSDPDTLVFVERWASAADLARHADQPWVKAAGALGPMLREPAVVDVLQALPAGDPVKGSLVDDA